MAPGLSDLIPGLREAEDRYRLISAEAFAGVEPDICKMVEIAPLTPKMYIDLDGAGNAFFAQKGTPILPADVANFLWRCSPYYCFGTEQARQTRTLFNANCSVLPYDQSVDEIAQYILRAWAGMPLWRSSNRSSASMGQWPSRLVHLFAKEYGWQEEYILGMPFRRLWQYANRILEDADPDYREQSPDALRARKQWLIDENERLAKEARN